MSVKAIFCVTLVSQILKYPLIIYFIEKYDDSQVIILFFTELYSLVLLIINKSVIARAARLVAIFRC